MKTKFLSIIISGFALLNAVYPQNIPNGGFENWEMRFLYEEPVWWNTGNQESFMSGEQTALKTTDSYSGNLALRIETVTSTEDTLFGYAFCNGRITSGDLGDTLYFDGGIPISAAPDSLFGYFKFNFAINDTGFVLISFKSGGNIISQNFYQLNGTQSTYTRLGFRIETMVETPDTALVAFACSNPDHPIPGGWIQVDSLWFGGIADTIWNADFELWEESSYQEPINWFTTNLFSYLFGGDIAATPTADAHSGDFALRLEAIQTMIPADEGLTEAVAGFAIPYFGDMDFRESLPTFPVGFNPSRLIGFYKFEPLLNDTAMLYIGLIDDEDNVYDMGAYLTTAATYQEFAIDLSYPTDVTITNACMIVNTSKYFMETGESGELGSVLYLDDVYLFNPCDTFPPYSIASAVHPTCDDSTATLDAGEGWDDYLWSNGDTTQIITVFVPEDHTIISVTVTDNNTGCQFSDEEILYYPTDCGGESTTLLDNQVSRMNLYPNPAADKIILSLYNLQQDIYTLELIDITGKILISKQITITEKNKKIPLNVSDLSEGLYLIKIEGENYSRCERLAIQ